VAAASAAHSSPITRRRQWRLRSGHRLRIPATPGGAPDEIRCYAFVLRISPIPEFPEEFHGQLAIDPVVFPEDPESEQQRVPAAGGDYHRLLELEKKWDPDNVFRMTHHIHPSA
jgi:hypothetical protein